MHEGSLVCYGLPHQGAHQTCRTLLDDMGQLTHCRSSRYAGAAWVTSTLPAGARELTPRRSCMPYSARPEVSGPACVICTLSPVHRTRIGHPCLQRVRLPPSGAEKAVPVTHSSLRSQGATDQHGNEAATRSCCGSWESTCGGGRTALTSATASLTWWPASQGSLPVRVAAMSKHSAQGRVATSDFVRPRPPSATARRTPF